MIIRNSKATLLEESAFKRNLVGAILTKPVTPMALYDAVKGILDPESSRSSHAEGRFNFFEAAHSIRGARILLVEDSNLNQLVAKEILGKAGLSVVIANHGGEALEWVQQEAFDAVLMDIQMPVMDGYEATRRIRELSECIHLPIIAMTAAAMHQDREACLAAGMNDHLAKPLDTKQLIKCLQHWINIENKMPRHAEVQSVPDTEWAELSARFSGFDLISIKQIVDGDLGQFRAFLEAFFHEFYGDSAILTETLIQGNHADARKILHKIKGSAGTIGATSLHHISQLLEAQLAEKTYDKVTLDEWITVFNKTLASIAEIVGQKA